MVSFLILRDNQKSVCCLHLKPDMQQNLLGNKASSPHRGLEIFVLASLASFTHRVHRVVVDTLRMAPVSSSDFQHSNTNSKEERLDMWVISNLGDVVRRLPQDFEGSLEHEHCLTKIAD
jgi:hypothetical protein